MCLHPVHINQRQGYITILYQIPVQNTCVNIMSILQLHSRLTPGVAFTRHDEITFSLLDVVTCPIRMEITSNMIMFNYQYYDKFCFKQHDISKTHHNRTYNTRRLKDPRTGLEFETQHAIRHLYIMLPTRDNLVELVKTRIPEISTEQIDDFVPIEDDQRTNTQEFINLIEGMAQSRRDSKKQVIALTIFFWQARCAP